MFLLMIRIPQSCFGVATIWSAGKGQIWKHKVPSRIFRTPHAILPGKRWECGWWVQQQSIDMSQRMYFQNLYEQVFLRGKNVADDNTNHRGARMLFLIMNSIDILEELRMLMMTMTHLREVSWRCNRSSTASSKRDGEAKGLLEPQTRCNLWVRVASRQIIWCWKLDVA